MKTMKLALFASALALTPFAASAQEVGATIFGNDGAPIGTVEQIDEQVVVIDTGKHKAPVPANAFYDAEAGLSVNTTKADLDAFMDQRAAEEQAKAEAALAKRDAALVVGAQVVSSGGKPAGTLTEVDLAADSITLESPEGPVLLTKKYFTIDPEGRLMALVTREQIATAVASTEAGGGAQ